MLQQVKAVALSGLKVLRRANKVALLKTHVPTDGNSGFISETLSERKEEGECT